MLQKNKQANSNIPSNRNNWNEMVILLICVLINVVPDAPHNNSMLSHVQTVNIRDYYVYTFALFKPIINTKQHRIKKFSPPNFSAVP